MNPNTYDALPTDVRSNLDDVYLSRQIPDDVIDIRSQGGVTRMPVNAFVRARRKARKAERQNRRSGRR